jgi:hypothetical protein
LGRDAQFGRLYILCILGRDAQFGRLYILCILGRDAQFGRLYIISINYGRQIALYSIWIVAPGGGI